MIIHSVTKTGICYHQLLPTERILNPNQCRSGYTANFDRIRIKSTTPLPGVVKTRGKIYYSRLTNRIVFMEPKFKGIECELVEDLDKLYSVHQEGWVPYGRLRLPN